MISSEKDNVLINKVIKQSHKLEEITEVKAGFLITKRERKDLLFCF